MKDAMRAILIGMTTLFMVASAKAEGARSLSVVSFDAATGVASLSFESAETANLLYAVKARGDRGTTDAEAWETAAYLGKVDGATTSDTYALPADWVARPGVIRFVLTTDHVRLYEAEIDYIVSAAPSGTEYAYVDTGIVPDATTSIEVSFVQRSGDAAAFGVSGRFYLFSSDPNNISYYGYFNDTVETGTSFTKFMTDNNKIYTVRLGPDGAWVDGVRKAGPFKNPSTTTTSTLTIGARRADGTTTVAKGGYFRIYGAKVVKGGHLVRDFIPVRTAADGSGERCLFDRVTKTLFRAAGKIGFNNTTRVGAEIVKSSDFPTEVTDWSAPLRLGRSVSVAEFNANTGVASVELTGPAGLWGQAPAGVMVLA